MSGGLTGQSPYRLSHIISHALRDEPWLYQLELGIEGWVPIEELLASIRETSPAWASVDRAQLESAVNFGDKRRHEIDGDRIRALYGHSVPIRIGRISEAPPPVLFHGTHRASVGSILLEGIRPMRRQHVHLSTDIDTTLLVGARRSPQPVIFTIDAVAAHDSGTASYVGNNKVWLADIIPPKFIKQLTEPPGQTTAPARDRG